MRVVIASGEGSDRASSVPCTIRPGVTPSSISTTSIAASSGWDSRSSRMSVRSTRLSRIAAGRCRTRSTYPCRPGFDPPPFHFDGPGRAWRRPLVPRGHERASRAITASSRRRRPDRRARATQRARRTIGRARRTGARVLQSATRAPVVPEIARARRRARAERHPGQMRPDESARRPPPAASARRPQATAPDRQACAGPSGKGSRRRRSRPQALESLTIQGLQNFQWQIRQPRSFFPRRHDGDARTRVREQPAAVFVPAIAICTESPCAAANRATSAAITRGGPITRWRPLTSKITLGGFAHADSPSRALAWPPRSTLRSRGLTSLRSSAARDPGANPNSMRGEHARAMASSAAEASVVD